MNKTALSEKISLLNKELKQSYVEVLEMVLGKLKGEELSVSITSEYNDNDYTTEIHYSLLGQSLTNAIYNLGDMEYADEEDLQLIQNLNKKGISLEEVSDLLNLIPSSFWENEFGFGDAVVDAKLIKKLKKAA